MTIIKTKRASAAAERPQRRRSGLKAPPAAVSVRAGRRAPAAGRAAAAGTAAAQASNVRVVVRVRPENERESQGGYRLVVRPLDDHMLIFDPRQQDEDFYFQGVRQRQRDLNKRASKDMQYMFDRVFHPHHSNQQLFEATTKDVIDTVIDGFNCSVFAYGSTGAGKTHTMLGTSSEPGIIFLTVMELYSRIAVMADTRCQVAVSYVEVYNETVTDLLQPSGPLDVREDGQRAVVIAGLSQQTPDGPEHLMAILAAGNQRRTQHPTDMNAESSRSHAVFQVTLRQSDGTAGLSQDVRVSKLSLIDLAGSERGSATGHKGARFREGANINRSLLALGSCINALADGKKFVPYRDSKLTRLLKDSIGGNCKTVMIANVTPSAASFEDTHNTLKYADRAKAIKTRLQRNVVSVDMHVAQYAKVVDELRQEVSELRAQLAERPAAAQTAPPPAEPPFDAAPLRAAEAARRALVTRQLQLEAEAQQLRLRLHRRRLCVQRAALLRPAGGARPDRQQDRLAGRLSLAHSRLEQARGELAAAVQTAEAEAGRAPAGPATDQLVDQLEKERQLDECRVHAAHLEAFSRLLQLELASSDHLLAQLIGAVREQHRVLTYMKFVTPELEAQYKEVVGLVEGQKEVCWADQQQPAADSPGQPSYDVTALLRLADTTYRPAEPLRQATGGLLLSAPAPAPAPAPAQPAAGRSVPRAAPVDRTPAPPPPPCPDGTPPSLSSVLPPSDTTLGGGADDEVLIAGGGGAPDETPCRPRHHRPGSPVFFDAEPGPETPRPGGPPGADAVAETETSPGPVQADRDLAEEAVTVPSPRESGPHRAESPAAEPAAPRTDATVSITPQTGTAGSVTPQTETARPVLPQTETARPATPQTETAEPATPQTGTARPVTQQTETARPTTPQAETAGPVTPRTDAAVSITPQTETAEPATPQASGGESERPDTLPAVWPAGDGTRVPGGRADSPPAGRRHSPAGDGPQVPAGRADSPPASPAATPGSPCKAVTTGGTPATEPRRPEAGARHSVSPNLNTTITMSPSESRLASPNVDLGATVTGPAPPASRKAPSPDLNATVTVSTTQGRKSASPDLNTTVTVAAPAAGRRRSPPAAGPPPAAGRRRSPPAVGPPPAAGRRRSPPAVDLNATRTLSPAAPGGSGLPAFDSCSPIRPEPADRALYVPLPPDLPPTPEILRRTRTPLKTRPSAAPPPSMDSTFTMEAAPFRVPLATSADGGGGPPAGGSGQRAVAGKGALRGSTSSTHLGVQRTGLSRSASAAHLSQTGRAGSGPRSTAGAPGSAARRGFEASARLAATAPNPSRLSLSAQKARSTSRLHTSASGGRDENQQPDRPAWGRTAPPAVGADKAAGRHGLISSVGKFGLGRSRTGAKDRPGGVLKPANQ